MKTFVTPKKFYGHFPYRLHFDARDNGDVLMEFTKKFNKSDYKFVKTWAFRYIFHVYLTSIDQVEWLMNHLLVGTIYDLHAPVCLNQILEQDTNDKIIVRDKLFFNEFRIMVNIDVSSKDKLENYLDFIKLTSVANSIHFISSKTDLRYQIYFNDTKLLTHLKLALHAQIVDIKIIKLSSEYVL